MLRWWLALEHCSRNRSEYLWSCPLGDPPAPGMTKVQGRWATAVRKYVSYPLQVGRFAKADLYHLLDHSWAQLLDRVPKGVPKIATVHDLIPLRFSDGLTKSQIERLWRVVSNIRSCDFVVADSETSRGDVIDLLGIPAERVGVVPLGVDLTPRPPAPASRVTA